MLSLRFSLKLAVEKQKHLVLGTALGLTWDLSFPPTDRQFSPTDRLWERGRVTRPHFSDPEGWGQNKEGVGRAEKHVCSFL